MNEASEGQTRPGLGCNANSLKYDFTRHTGELYIEDGEEGCDMHGCITFFESIDPNVRLIHTFSGNEPDTVYWKEEREWKAKPGPLRR